VPGCIGGLWATCPQTLPEKPAFDVGPMENGASAAKLLYDLALALQYAAQK
jgi:hypothetical protein